MRRYIFNPFTALMVILLAVIVFILIPLLFLSIIGTAFTKLGFSWRETIAILVLSIIGSFINIPVKKLENREIIQQQHERTLYGWVYRIPQSSPVTVIAVNIGGAIIPLLISLYLYPYGLSLAGPAFIILSTAGILIVTLITYRVARLVPGLGIATPFFLPPAAALLCGLVLGGGFGTLAAIIAYMSGTLGTLIGADILNLPRIQELGAPLVSIGGAGTFDGIFLSGIIAAFLA